MRVIEDTTKGKRVEYLYSEFVDFAEKRKKSEDHKNNDSRTGSFEFTQTDSLEQCLTYARQGWDAGLEQLPLENGTLANSGSIFEADVYGSIVNMSSYLMGLPDNMFNLREEREFLLEELTIYVPLMYHGYNDSEDALTFCKSIVEIVNKYQAKYNVKIVGSFFTKQRIGSYITDVVIKDFDQRFVLNNIAFAFHPSFFRRLWFAHLEAETYCTGGYGSSMDKNAFQSIVKKENGKNKALIIPTLESTKSNKHDFTENEVTFLNF